MSYNSERYKKSVLTTCSRSRTAVPGSSDLVEVSNIVHCSGASIECANGHHVLKHKGLYRADAKTIFTADKNGSVIAWIALDNAEIHCSRVVFNEHQTWDNYTKNVEDLGMVRTYVTQKVKLIFDPPLTSSVLDAMKAQIAELEWRLSK